MIYIRIYIYLNINIKTNMSLITSNLYKLALFLRFDIITNIFFDIKQYEYY